MRLASTAASPLMASTEETDVGRAVPDLSNYEIARAFREAGCPLCRVVAADEERSMQQFWRDSRLLPAVRRVFFASGGFCRRHAWLLHAQVMRAGRGGALTDIYDAMLARDAGRIATILDGHREQQDLAEELHDLVRQTGCRACEELEATTKRRAHFACNLLHEDGMVAAYRASDGFCFRHLTVVLAAIGDGDSELRLWLLADWGERIAALRAGLAEFERKRDYRHADEPRGEEQRAPTEAVRRYAGEPPDA
jgi:hypothetical protein